MDYPNIATYLLVSVIKIAIVIVILLTAVAYSVLLERKLVGRIQNRWGPSRVGPFGLLQPLADGLKLILKEDLTPPHVYRPIYILAPILSLTLALTSIAVIPFGNVVRIGRNITTPLQITDLNIGVLVILGVTSMGVYGIALSGWSSNNKYSLLGSLRASAQMISYELALGLSLIGVLILSGTLSLRGIVDAQQGGILHWNFFGGLQFVAFFIYLMAAYAETNRTPFDLPMSEAELVQGFQTEYSSMPFALFFLGEYANMITVGCLATILFFGGWHGPVPSFTPAFLQPFVPVFWFMLKVFFFIFLYIWVRGTVPRFRYDQLMGFGWKVLLPLALANVVVTSLVVALRS